MEWTCPSCGRRQVKRRRVHKDGICQSCLDAGVAEASALEFDPPLPDPPEIPEPAAPQTPTEAVAALVELAGDPDMAFLRARHAQQWPDLWDAIEDLVALDNEGRQE